MDIVVKPKVSQQDLLAAGARISNLLQQYQEMLLQPDAIKIAPSFTTSQVVELSGISVANANYKMTKKELPVGTLTGLNKTRYFTVAETQQWVRHHKPERLRPASCYAITIAIANFKGGVAKSTTTMTLAQGLSLRGHKVLVIDCDAQGSLTSLHGLLPSIGIDDEQTLRPLFSGETDSVKGAIQKTYWPGIDLIAANLSLYSAELELPTNQLKGMAGYEFWSVLNKGLDFVREDYDVILIDTAPALSYVTINALVAANGIIIPMPPDMLTFTSSAGFVDLFNDLLDGFYTKNGKSKEYSFIDVLLTKVEADDRNTATIREWVKSVFGNMLMPIEIPKTAVATNSSSELGTIYDMKKGSIDSRTYKRAHHAYEEFARQVENQLIAIWATQGEGENNGN